MKFKGYEVPTEAKEHAYGVMGSIANRTFRCKMCKRVIGVGNEEGTCGSPRCEA